jgi:hypothetical protein
MSSHVLPSDRTLERRIETLGVNAALRREAQAQYRDATAAADRIVAAAQAARSLAGALFGTPQTH